jgi:hypothetical protein
VAARPVVWHGGTLAIIDVLAAADLAARARLALYELGLLLRTERGRVYSIENYRAWVQAAGFRELSTRPLVGPVDISLMTARIRARTVVTSRSLRPHRRRTRSVARNAW